MNIKCSIKLLESPCGNGSLVITAMNIWVNPWKSFFNYKTWRDIDFFCILLILQNQVTGFCPEKPGDCLKLRLFLNTKMCFIKEDHKTSAEFLYMIWKSIGLKMDTLGQVVSSSRCISSASKHFMFPAYMFLYFFGR